jgi:hypothetical protein
LIILSSFCHHPAIIILLSLFYHHHRAIILLSILKGINKQLNFIMSTAVELIGPYHGDSYGEGGTHTKACGWENLTIGKIFTDGRKAPNRIDHDGTPIGWAPDSSIKYK